MTAMPYLEPATSIFHALDTLQSVDAYVSFNKAALAPVLLRTFYYQELRKLDTMLLAQQITDL